MASEANRGKVGEGKLKQALTKMSVKGDTAFYRLPDARAGSFMPTLADFLVAHKGKAYLIECKEVKHDYRLPHANFSTDQVARMRMFQMTQGITSLVFIYHSTVDMWRAYNVERFLERENGSWDLRDSQPRSLEEILHGESNSMV